MSSISSYYIKLRVFGEFGNIVSLEGLALSDTLGFYVDASNVDVLMKKFSEGGYTYSTTLISGSSSASVKFMLSSSTDSFLERIFKSYVVLLLLMPPMARVMIHIIQQEQLILKSIIGWGRSNIVMDIYGNG